MNISRSHRDLGDLCDPTKYQEPIDITGCSSSLLRTQLKTMTLIRMAEQELALRRKQGLIGGPVHLGAGQEAVAVGVASALRPTDRVFGGHRSHSHILAMGSSLSGLFAEVLGKQTGLSKGMGGSMHLWDGPRGFLGAVPIVAGTVSLAVGAGLAAKLQASGDVSVAYFGDGAVEEGAMHESLNLARVLKVPTIFVAENNFFSSHMHIGLRQPLNGLARFADAHDIECEVVDGNDVVLMSKAAERLITRARNGGGPGFIEAVTFRWYGHVDWRDDIDVGVNRSMTDIANWKARDPISRLRAALQNQSMWSENDENELRKQLTEDIDAAWQTAMNAPWPSPEVLLDYVYSKPREGK